MLLAGPAGSAYLSNVPVYAPSWAGSGDTGRADRALPGRGGDTPARAGARSPEPPLPGAPTKVTARTRPIRASTNDAWYASSWEAHLNVLIRRILTAVSKGGRPERLTVPHEADEPGGSDGRP